MEVQTMHLAHLRQKFDFAASHRLHNPTLSDDENRRLYGKRNNPRGHGHNYQFEPCIEVEAGEGAPAFTLEMLETLAKQAILDRFDHRHLNEDTAEFRQPGGLNPSVENIAKVFYDLLRAEMLAMNLPGRLRHVTVWETDRTCATFPG
jgi:6-pyruvoyltetrahydropterin/6-carboxytetrahydropterin synthase